jgi:hypothetical protein
VSAQLLFQMSGQRVWPTKFQLQRTGSLSNNLL